MKKESGLSLFFIVVGILLMIYSISSLNYPYHKYILKKDCLYCPTNIGGATDAPMFVCVGDANYFYSDTMKCYKRQEILFDGLFFLGGLIFMALAISMIFFPIKYLFKRNTKKDNFKIRA